MLDGSGHLGAPLATWRSSLNTPGALAGVWGAMRMFLWLPPCKRLLWAWFAREFGKLLALYPPRDKWDTPHRWTLMRTWDSPLWAMSPPLRLFEAAMLSGSCECGWRDRRRGDMGMVRRGWPNVLSMLYQPHSHWGASWL